MLYKREGNTIILRLDKGDEMIESVRAVAKRENVFAAKVSGIGATDDFTVGVFDTDIGEYEKFEFRGGHEINSLTGNISEKDGEPYIHLHITCTGKNCKVVGGHLISGVISLTGEIFISIIDYKIPRKFDDSLGINRWDL